MDVLNLEIIDQYKEMLGAEVLSETVSLYENQAIEYMKKLEQAIEAQDYGQWKDSCHVLKSASGNVGLKAVYQKVADLEYSKQDFTSLAQELAVLQQLNLDGLQAIKKWLTQG